MKDETERQEAKKPVDYYRVIKESHLNVRWDAMWGFWALATPFGLYQGQDLDELIEQEVERRQIRDREAAQRAEEYDRRHAIEKERLNVER